MQGTIDEEQNDQHVGRNQPAVEEVEAAGQRGQQAECDTSHQCTEGGDTQGHSQALQPRQGVDITTSNGRQRARRR
jgi:hypothetical protein